MNSPLATAPAATVPAGAPFDRAARRIVHAILERMPAGQLTVVEGSDFHHFGSADAGFPLHATVIVHDPRFYRSLLAGGVGMGQSYIEGHWDSDDLVALIRICARNLGTFDRLKQTIAPVAQPVRRGISWVKRNTPERSRERISYHYDLGNDFFQQFLDSTLTYSSGVFEHPQASMEDASRAKLDRICRKLDLQPGDEVLEIGTGWGSFALHAASTYGCRVTTTTISQAQHDLATRRIAEAGLQDRVTVLLSDYRHLKGTYDKLVSIEMIEAVGWEYHDTFFHRCSKLLRADGVMCLQGITIAEQLFDEVKVSDDFIKRFIFPGGCLISVGAVMDSVGRTTDMRLVQLEEITPHYVETLARWREAFYARLPEIRALGYQDRRFLRMWEYYLCYCEGGFAERRIGVGQFVLARPGFRSEQLLDQMDRPADDAVAA